MQATATEAKVAPAFQLIQHFDATGKGCFADWPHGLDQIGHAFQLIQRHFNVAAVAQQAFEQGDQLFGADIGFNLLQFIHGQIVETVDRRHEIMHQFGPFLAAPFGQLRLLGQVGDLGGQGINFLGEFGQFPFHNCLLNFAATCRPCSSARATAYPVP